MLVYALIEDSLSPPTPLGDSAETFISRGAALRFKVRGDDPDPASYLRIEERES